MESFSGGAVNHYPSLLVITDHYWPGKPNISLVAPSLKSNFEPGLPIATLSDTQIQMQIHKYANIYTKTNTIVDHNWPGKPNILIVAHFLKSNLDQPIAILSVLKEYENK